MNLRRLSAVGVVVLSVLAGVVVPVAGAAAAAATAPASVTITGHGYGHGRGMSQYGAFGYALSGWGYEDILRKYYGGTKLATTARAAATTRITVRLSALIDRDIKVTVPKASFTVAGTIHFPAGRAVTMVARPDGYINVYRAVGCAGKGTRIAIIKGSQGVIVPDVTPGNDVTKMLTVCRSGVDPAYRGRLTFIPRADPARPPATVRRTINTVSLDDYLRGVVPREAIASWGDAGGGKGMNALRVQTVAARTYAAAENRYPYAKTCDTTACQVYGGAGSRGARIEDPRTDAAVRYTSGKVLLTPTGTFAYAEFGSSSGGWTAGGQFPAVSDTGDATPSNPYHNWSVRKDIRTLGPRFGVGTLKSAVVKTRNGLGADGGRVLTVLLTGTTGRTATVSGDDVRLALGLYSNWFVLHTG